MPNIVNEALLSDLEKTFQEMGSCVVVDHGAVGPKQDIEIRTQLREAGIHYRLVRTRIAQRALQNVSPGLGETLQGRCGFAIAPEEGAIKAAKILRDWIKKTKDAPIAIKGGVVEGTVYAGKDAAMIADLPDRDTVNTQIVTAISGPARSLASIVSAVAGGLARCIQAKIDKES